MGENKKPYIYQRVFAENSKGADLESQFDEASKFCADDGIKLATSKLMLTTGTMVLINEEAKMHLPICHTGYCLNYKTEDEAVKNFVRDLELLEGMDKKGSFDGYINSELFASLIRINDSSDKYYFTGGNNIDIAEIKEQYYKSTISKNDIFCDA